MANKQTSRMKLTDFTPSMQARIRAANPQLAPQPFPVETAEVPKDRYKSQLERDYAAHLDMLLAGGVIVWWEYEPWRLRIAVGKKQAFYKPDFVVKVASGETEFHELKGFWHTADRLRIKVAAGLYPYKFVAVQREGGGWKREEF